MYGGWPVYVSSFVWLCIWSVIAGFSKNELMLDFCRAIRGFGPAAYLPASFMLLGSMLHENQEGITIPGPFGPS